MNIQAQKISLAKLILETDNPAILESIKSVFVKARHSDFWETLSYEQKAEIEQGISQIVSEETVEYESVMKKQRKLN
jgi:hypothetical protein